MTLTSQAERYSIYMLLVSWIPNFSPFHSNWPLSRVANSRKYTEWPWTHNSEKYSVYIKYPHPRSKQLSVSLCDQLFSRYKVVEMIGKISNAPNDLRLKMTLNCQKYLAYINYLLVHVKFPSILLYDQTFSRYKVAENQKFWKCTK